MATLWVLEQNNHNLPRITDILIGDFAVRAVASPESLASIAKINGAQLPDALIVDCRVKEWPISKIASLIQDILPSCVVFAVVSSAIHFDSLPPTLHKLNLLDNVIQFVSDIRSLIRQESRSKSGDIIRYRDLMLDVANLKLRLGESTETISLPQKELQLLKLLVTNCGQVICRAEISATIWNGIKVSPRTIDSHISRLRSKLLGSKISIRSVYGGGYLLR